MNTEKNKNYSGYYGFASKQTKKKSNDKFVEKINSDEHRKLDRQLKRYRSYGLKYANDEHVSAEELKKFVNELINILSKKSS